MSAIPSLALALATTVVTALPSPSAENVAGTGGAHDVLRGSASAVDGVLPSGTHVQPVGQAQRIDEVSPVADGQPVDEVSPGESIPFVDATLEHDGANPFTGLLSAEDLETGEKKNTAGETTVSIPAGSVEENDVAPVSNNDSDFDPDFDFTADPDFDFDLLGEPEPVAPPVDASLLARRRLMLKGHQAMGLALVALMAGTMVSGQLNYWDGHVADETGRFKLTHRVLSYSTLGAFALTGGAAIFAPVPPDRTSSGLDRVMLHRIGLFGAAAGMAAQAILGPLTVSRQGYFDQQQLAVAHLAVGWTTFALMALGVGAIVF